MGDFEVQSTLRVTFRGAQKIGLDGLAWNPAFQYHAFKNLVTAAW